MTYRDYMIGSNDNLCWCKPISFDGGSIVIARNDGEITGIFADGEDLDVTPENIRAIALRIDDPDHCDRELACRECPWFTTCCAMDENCEEE